MSHAALLEPRSALKYEMVNPVLLPALFVVLGAERSFFTVADRLDVLCGDPLLHERSFHRLRAAGSKGDVIFLGSAVVAMPFDQNLDARMLGRKASSFWTVGASSGRMAYLS